MEREKSPAPGNIIADLLGLTNKGNNMIRSIRHFTLFYRHNDHVWATGLQGHVWESSCLKEPLRCSPRGLPDIISHYSHHSSNTAGARDYSCLVGSRLPHVCLPFSAALSLTPCGAFPNVTPGRLGEMQICPLWRSMLMWQGEEEKGINKNCEMLFQSLPDAMPTTQNPLRNRLTCVIPVVLWSLFLWTLCPICSGK